MEVDEEGRDVEGDGEDEEKDAKGEEEDMPDDLKLDAAEVRETVNVRTGFWQWWHKFAEDVSRVLYVFWVWLDC